jgi:hypothetical protein
MIGIVVGLIIGLTIGWVFWPVEWQNATPAILDAHNRQDYLRAAIDSYMVNQDANLAMDRYAALGEYAGSTLSAIYSNPMNQTAEAVQAFATAVNAQAVLQAPPGVPAATEAASGANPPVTTEAANANEPVETGAAPATPAGTEKPVSTGTGGLLGLLSRYLLPAALALVALLIGLGVLLWLFGSARRRTRANKRPEKLEEASAVETLEATPAVMDQPEQGSDLQEASLADVPDWLQAAAPAESGGRAAEAAKYPDSATAGEAFSAPSNDLPDWLNEEPGMAAAAETQDMRAGGGVEMQNNASLQMDDLPDWLKDETETEDDWVEETPEQVQAKFTRDLATLPAMEADFANRLRGAGAGAVALLLKKGANPAGRLALSQKAGVDLDELNTWVRVSDLLRVRNLSPEHAILLEGVGVLGVSGLAQADAAALATNLQKTNAEVGLLEKAPSQALVAYWIEQAGQMPKVIE